MVSPSGAQVEGWLRDDVAHGDGILTWPDGGKFIGKYVDGKVRQDQYYDGYVLWRDRDGYVVTGTLRRLRYDGYMVTVH